MNARALLSTGPNSEETRDSICGGLVQVIQRREGYRFNLDPVLLAHFAVQAGVLKPPIIDLGTGSGVIPLILTQKFGLDVTGLEVQQPLFELAERNVHLNRCEGRIALVLGDWRRVKEKFSAASFSNALANPPYRAFAQGRVSPDAEKAVARHEMLGALSDFCVAASYLLVERGSIFIVYPALRTTELLACLTKHGLEPKRIRFVHPRGTAPAKLLLLQAVKSGRGGLVVDPPLLLHKGTAAAYTDEVEGMLGGV